jgi:hypothetical protein
MKQKRIKNAVEVFFDGTKKPNCCSENTTMWFCMCGDTEQRKCSYKFNKMHTCKLLSKKLTNVPLFLFYENLGK